MSEKSNAKPKSRRGGRRAGAGRPNGAKNKPKPEEIKEIKHGGARPGTGAKPGSTYPPRGRKVPLSALNKETTPVDLLIQSMQALWATAITPDGMIDIDRAKEACSIAKDVAPYVHPKLAQIEGNPDKPLLPPSSFDMIDDARRLAFMWRRAKELVAAQAAGKVIDQE